MSATNASQSQQPRMFAGVFPTGISYCDRWREVNGDYEQIAFLPFRTLKLENCNCPDELWPAVQEHAERIISRRGEQFQVSTSGQTVTLGE